MQRIYLPNTSFDDILEITDKDMYHQITRVMRARLGQTYVFFDGEHLQDIEYEVIHIDKKSASFKRKNIIEKSSENMIELNLYQAIPNKLSKLETIVQKCSEVWYVHIIFFESENSQKLVLSDNKKGRLKKIAIEAIEQCGWNIIPSIEYRKDLWVIPKESVLCHTEGTDSISLYEIDALWKIAIIVWPEWGFSDDELIKIEAKKIYFWSRVLRCETVGEVVWFYVSQKK